MPHVSSTGGDDLCSTDEVKVFKDEGDGEDEKRSSENLTEEKSSLIDLTESEEKSGGKIEPTPHTSSFNMGYLMSPYSYANGAATSIQVRIYHKPTCRYIQLFVSYFFFILAKSCLTCAGKSNLRYIFAHSFLIIISFIFLLSSYFVGTALSCLNSSIVELYCIGPVGPPDLMGTYPNTIGVVAMLLPVLSWW
ncbi:uncharacterized protein LOC108741017 [Agrilus planipennis]|uniref:Uncharacterized protein LOC108741017 n=1 Tax=Agrilus planipennis TaxID=224129 RepID=A0A1W4X4P4_AGRPL|nr:uncharacterized protein LOC108741017 [Agrilus planipennis]